MVEEMTVFSVSDSPVRTISNTLCMQLMKGSVIVIITLSDSDNITSANLTVLLNQLEQDVS